MTEGISSKLRQEILERDSHTSGMRHYSEARGWYFNDSCPFDHKPCDQLQVHHIQPRRSGGAIEDPDNLITLFQCEHVGVCNSRRICNG